jgi:hypothetical protein
MAETLRPVGLAKLLDLLDRGLDVRQRTGCGPAVHDKLIHISVRHVLHTTEVGHDDGYGTAHARSATDEDPIIRMVTIDPINRLLKGGRFGFTEFLERNSFVNDTGRRVGGEFFSNQENGADLRRRLLYLINVSHEERIRNLIHGASIEEDRLHVKHKRYGHRLQSTFSERYTPLK